MKCRSLFQRQSVIATALLWLFLCHSLLVEAKLTFHPFRNASLTCADGSPFGVYVEEDSKIPLEQSRNHILILMGGGSCANPEDCRKEYKAKPFVFSTSYNRSTIQGDGLLSQDPRENPSMHSFTKYLIPYCSQDFFLGDIQKGQVGDFHHMGATLLREAFDFWSDQVLQAGQSANNDTTAGQPLLDTVVVAGISAGAVGLMNNIPTVREAVNSVGTQSLKLVLDAPSVISDYEYVGKDFNDAMNLYVDVQDDFPLCSPTHHYSGLYDSVSKLPCCLSPHCMMRHDVQGLASFFVNNTNTEHVAKEKLLILDSVYDTIALLGGTTFLQEDRATATTNPLGGMLQNSDNTWQMMESAGGRKTRAQETAAVATALARQQQPNAQESNMLENRVLWIMTSCVSHSFLAPSREFLMLACDHSDIDVENFDMVCNQYGQATRYSDPDYNLHFRLWRTIQVWDQVHFEGQTIHEIMDEFVTDTTSARSSTFGDEGQALTLRLEDCSGPNCMSPIASSYLEHPSCQALVEIENTFKPIPPAFQASWMIFIFLLIIASFAMRRRRPRTSNLDSLAEAKKHRMDDSSRRADVYLRLESIRVTTKDQQKTLIHDIDLELKTGSITGLVGRSGSGKSTLLKVLSQNQQPNLCISMEKESQGRLASLTKAYLCQQDPLEGFGNLYPVDFLTITAELYNADPDKSEDLYAFTRELLCRGKQENNQQDESAGGSNALNPFFDTRLANLSGGQRRILSIAATFLRDVQLVLLDEPLSGLDSVSSLQVMAALESFSKLGKCTALLSVHQPSADILAHFKKVILLGAGKVMLDERVIDPEKTADAIDQHLLRSHEISQRTACSGGSARHLRHSVVNGSQSLAPPRFMRSVSRENGSTRRMLVRQLEDVPEPFEIIEEDSGEVQVAGSGADCPPTDDSDSSSEPRRDTSLEETLASPSAMASLYDILRQVKPISERIHCQKGYEFSDCITMVVAYCVLAVVMLVNEGSHLQVVLSTASMIAVPTFLFTHKIFEYNELWQSHRFELDDKRMSTVSFQIATSLFTYPAPLLAAMVATALAYAILGWSFSTFGVQLLFVFVYFMVAMQFGRSLCILFHGRFGAVMKVYTTVLFAWALFSCFVQSTQFPDELNFLFYLSATFWALSGAVLNIFNDESYGQERPCFDFFSCVLSDGNVAGRTIGFAPLSNSYRALGVLTVVFVAFVVLEAALLHLRSNGAVRVGGGCPCNKPLTSDAAVDKGNNDGSYHIGYPSNVASAPKANASTEESAEIGGESTN